MLLVRDGDGALRGWSNVCRHRGHELLAPGATRTGRAIRCPYHDWVYGLPASCRATPRVRQGHRRRAGPAEFGLVPARVEQWHGWVFANVSGDAPPLAEQLGNAAVVVDGYDRSGWLGARHDYEVAANWKVIVENYLECYHCATITRAVRGHPAGVRHGLPGAPAGAWIGGPLALRDGVADDVAGRPQPRRPDPGLPAEQHLRGRVRGAAADAAGQPAPGLPDDAPPGAAGGRPHRRRVQLVLPAEAWDRPGFDSGYAADFWDGRRQDWACESVSQHRLRGWTRPSPLGGRRPRAGRGPEAATGRRALTPPAARQAARCRASRRGRERARR